jgi:hypothetical protein
MFKWLLFFQYTNSNCSPFHPVHIDGHETIMLMLMTDAISQGSLSIPVLDTKFGISIPENNTGRMHQRPKMKSRL